MREQRGDRPTSLAFRYGMAMSENDVAPTALAHDPKRAPLVTVAEINAFIGGEFGGNSNACEEMAFGMAVAVMHPSSMSLRPGKIISGPTVFGICDAALFYAALSATGMEPMTLTSEMSIRFLRPARGEVIRAKAILNSVGSRSIVGSVVAYTDDENRPVAVAQGTYMRPKKPSTTTLTP